MDTIHIKELLFPIENGATIPIRGVSDDGIHYVIKTFNNIQGNKVLVNEFVCYKLAKKLNLTIPNAKLGIIDYNTIISDSVNALEDFGSRCYGICFCSEYLDSSLNITSAKMIKETDNHNWLTPMLILFDHLVYNKDRNRGNLLIASSKNTKFHRQLYIFDHSHTFNLEAIWDAKNLKDKIEDKDYMDVSMMDCNSYIYSKLLSNTKVDLYSLNSAADYFKANLSHEFIHNIITQVPTLWESNTDDLKSLEEYLIYRLEHLNDFISIISSHIY